MSKPTHPTLRALSGRPPSARNDPQATEANPLLADADEHPRVENHASLERGDLVGVYEIIRPLGRGGMGAVYLARDPRLGRRVAIKVLAAVDDELRKRMLIEARATARCRHENIVVIFEVGEVDGAPFLVLEHLEGTPLNAVLRDSTMAPRRAVEVALPVAQALQAAHLLDVVHRDLKPANVFITRTGAVKVLDFGLAKAISADQRMNRPTLAPPASGTTPAAPRVSLAELTDTRTTRPGTTLGTLHFMAPEQLLGHPVDGRADLWALGVMLHDMITGEHPLGGNPGALEFAAMAQGKRAMPSLARLSERVDPSVARIIDRCCKINRDDRYADAAEVIADLEDYLSARGRASLHEGECPYPGLRTFRDSESDAFFGRSSDIRRLRARLRDQPLVVLVGASGVGKSSLIGAGLRPTLMRSGEPWRSFEIRPGRNPLGACASLLAKARGAHSDRELDDLAEQVRREPGTVGAALREIARDEGCEVLVVVDQLEELYTLGASRSDRLAFTSALRAVADDPGSPLRVVATIRADWMERVAEDPSFMELVTQGLMLLAPLGRDDLREALVRPAELSGCSLEEPLIRRMLDDLADTPGPLPLLQFAATKLWDTRDLSTGEMTLARYDAMGGIDGALAVHAEAVFAELPSAVQAEAKGAFLRLVTPNKTRALVTLQELMEQASDPDAVRALIETLVQARLLVAHSEAEGTTVEVAHEALIHGWPRIARWVDGEREESVALHQLREAARQWEDRDRSEGLLWSGDALVDARRWSEQDPALAQRERDFLKAARAAEGRRHSQTRRRRRIAMGALILVAAGALVAMISVSGAERRAREEAEHARDEAERALALETEAARAAALAATESEGRRAAEEQAEVATARVEQSEDDLAATNAQLQRALAEQRREAERAELARDQAQQQAARAGREAERAGREAERAGRAEQELRGVVQARERRVRELESRLSTISTELR